MQAANVYAWTDATPEKWSVAFAPKIYFKTLFP